MYVCMMFRLEDFENSCSAYEKALELGSDYMIHLNYAITLFRNDEIEKAREQFVRFDLAFNKRGEGEVDPDVIYQSSLLKAALTGE